MNVQFLEGEYWYGGVVDISFHMPVGPEDDRKICMSDTNLSPDQFAPLFFSNKGRFLHSDKAFDVHFCKGTIQIEEQYEVELSEGHGSLKGAQQAAAGKYYQLTGTIPNTKFFETPQYNTWIELMYDQNQKQILEYAHTMLEGGMPAGVLMIDEGWAQDYGVYDFDAAKFSDPKAMIAELHSLGYKVMLWVTPMISPDSNCFRELRKTDLLLQDANGEIAIRKWWNGYSCVLDFSNPATCDWFRGKLQYLMDTYGVDGFKFDCGDYYLYRADDKAHIVQEAPAHNRSFVEFCSGYTFNELRNVWNCSGMPIVCRLQDKMPAWDKSGLATLLPNMLTQGLLGYFYGCPDMIGGGNYGGFLKGYQTDEEMYLRWLGASILCPMMQFSISPKRVLSAESYEKVCTLVDIRNKYLDKIIQLAENASRTGEPVMRLMEYVFPGCGYEKVTDQFLLGEDILVAPILEKGAISRKVYIPEGVWKTTDGITYVGPVVAEIEAKLDEVIILER